MAASRHVDGLLIALLLATSLAGCTDEPVAARADVGVIDVGVIDDVGVEPDAASDAGATENDAAPDATPDTTADAGDDAGAMGGLGCDDAIDVTTGGVWSEQTTTGGRDALDSSAQAEGCPSGAASGPERIYVVRPGATTTYEVTVTPEDAGYDPLLYVKGSCEELAPCVAGTVLKGPGEPETVRFTADPGQPRFVIVDGELLSEGAFTLTVNPL